MASLNTVGDRKSLTEVDVRVFMRDYDPDLNILLDDYEYTSDEIRQAQTLCVDRWNETPPIIDNYTVDTFPFRYYYLLGTCANLMTMAAMSYRRNKLNAQITGGAVDPNAKAKEYEVAAAKMSADFREWMNRAKAQINQEQCWVSL